MSIKVALLIYIVITVFILSFIILAGYQQRIKESTDKKIRLINDRFMINKKGFSYSDKWEKLKSYGLNEDYSKPVYYFATKTILGIVVVLMSLMLTYNLHAVAKILFGIVGFVIGWNLFDLYASQKNKSDNDKMSDDIETMYNVLSTQMKSGVYVSEALSETTDLVVNSRLKKALEEFKHHYKLNDLTLRENVRDFESKFCNDDISTLCMIINQNEDNGHSKDILHDLLNQIHSIEELRYEKQKAKTDNVLTLFMMIMFADFMIFIIYEFVIQTLFMI